MRTQEPSSPAPALLLAIACFFVGLFALSLSEFEDARSASFAARCAEAHIDADRCEQLARYRGEGLMEQRR